MDNFYDSGEGSHQESHLIRCGHRHRLTEKKLVADQPPFTVDYVNRDNGIICTANINCAGNESMKMDFRRADRIDSRKLNVIL